MTSAEASLPLHYLAGQTLVWATIGLLVLVAAWGWAIYRVPK